MEYRRSVDLSQHFDSQCFALLFSFSVFLIGSSLYLSGKFFGRELKFRNILQFRKFCSLMFMSRSVVCLCSHSKYG